MNDIQISNVQQDSSILLELFNFWYGLKFYPTNDTKRKNLVTTNFSVNHLRDVWQNIWFAKQDRQKEMDQILQKYKEAVNLYVNYEPNEFFEKFAIIVLYDQVTRNIFRGTGEAYAYDPIARKIALGLLEEIDSLPIQFRLTVLICLCHSENIDHQSKIREYTNMLKNSDFYEEYKEIINTMMKIADNHYIRVLNFGRIPERNPFVGRVDTPEESDFLKSLKSK